MEASETLKFTAFQSDRNGSHRQYIWLTEIVQSDRNGCYTIRLSTYHCSRKI